MWAGTPTLHEKMRAGTPTLHEKMRAGTPTLHEKMRAGRPRSLVVGETPTLLESIPTRYRPWSGFQNQ